VTSDAAGNSYVAGTFSGSVDFDAGSGATVRVAAGPSDISVASYAADGSFRWVYTIGGTDVDAPFNIKLAADGGLYVTGYATAGAVCAGRLLPNGGDRDILLMRISPTGSCDWAITVGGSGDDEGHDLAVAANGDVIVTGQFSGSVDFDPGAGASVLVSRGGLDGFVARYAADGTYRSVAQFGGPGDDAGNAVALRGDGDVIVGGAFSGTASFGSTAPVELLTSVGGLDFAVARFTPDLELEWAVSGGGQSDDIIGTGGIIVGPDGTIYLAGTFTGVANVTAGGPVLVSRGGVDVFIAALTSAGAPTGFAGAFGGSGTESVSTFARDASGNLYLGGSFQGSVDFSLGSTAHVLNALGTGGASDGYLLSIAPTGDFRWVNPISAAVTGDGSTSAVAGISLATDGTIWAVGQFFGLVDFDPGTGNVSRQSLGDADQFVVRFEQGTGAIKQ
jgi:hypothetical protein